MKQARFRGLCITLSLIGVVSGFFLPIIQIKKWDIGIALYKFLFDLDGISLATSKLDGSESILVLFVPFIFGLITAILCLMKSRPIKTLFSAISAGSMLVLPMVVKSYLLKQYSGDSFSNFLGGFFEKAVNKFIVLGSGYYVFIVCFGLCFLFCMLGVRNIQLAQVFQTVKVRCPKCGALNDESGAFCSGCGEKMVAAFVNSSAEQADQPPTAQSAIQTEEQRRLNEEQKARAARRNEIIKQSRIYLIPAILLVFFYGGAVGTLAPQWQYPIGPSFWQLVIGLLMVLFVIGIYKGAFTKKISNSQTQFSLLLGLFFFYSSQYIVGIQSKHIPEILWSLFGILSYLPILLAGMAAIYPTKMRKNPKVAALAIILIGFFLPIVMDMTRREVDLSNTMAYLITPATLTSVFAALTVLKANKNDTANQEMNTDINVSILLVSPKWNYFLLGITLVLNFIGRVTLDTGAELSSMLLVIGAELFLIYAGFSIYTGNFWGKTFSKKTQLISYSAFFVVVGLLMHIWQEEHFANIFDYFDFQETIQFYIAISSMLWCGIAMIFSDKIAGKRSVLIVACIFLAFTSLLFPTFFFDNFLVKYAYNFDSVFFYLLNPNTFIFLFSVLALWKEHERMKAVQIPITVNNKH